MYVVVKDHLKRVAKEIATLLWPRAKLRSGQRNNFVVWVVVKYIMSVVHCTLVNGSVKKSRMRIFERNYKWELKPVYSCGDDYFVLDFV